jgi:hypothetical protein
LPCDFLSRSLSFLHPELNILAVSGFDNSHLPSGEPKALAPLPSGTPLSAAFLAATSIDFLASYSLNAIPECLNDASLNLP